MSELTLVEFLTARLDEDRALARAAETQWRNEWTSEDVPVTRHIERHDPARVLVEVEAKRAIVDVHFGSDGDGGRWWCNACADGAYGDKADWPCPTLRLLALSYADAPGYDERWRP